MRQENVLTRALLAREFSRNMDELNVQLFAALSQARPIDKINEIQKLVDERVQDAIRSGIWPFDPPLPPEEEIRPQVMALVSRIRQNHMETWEAAPPERA